MAVTDLYLDPFTDYGAPGSTVAAQVAFLAEGFYTTVTNSNTTPSQGPICVDPEDPAGYCYGYTNPSGVTASLTQALALGAQTVVNIAGRVYVTSLPSSANGSLVGFAIQPAAGGTTLWASVNPTGGISIASPGSGVNVVYASTLLPVITVGSWHHWEVIITAVGTSPTYSWRALIDGVEVEFDVDTATTSNHGDPAIVTLGRHIGGGAGTATGASFFKDFIIATGDGTDIIGTRFVIGAELDADVSNTGWAPSAGTDVYPILSTNPPGATYVSASDTSVPETYEGALAAVLPSNTSSVQAVMVVMRGTKSDGGDASVKFGVVSTGTTDYGPSRPFGTSYTNYYDLWNTDPHTSAAWSKSAVDNLDLIMQRES